MFDSDETGSLNMDEFMNGCLAVNRDGWEPPEPPVVDEIEEIFDMIENDSDDLWSLDEFTEWAVSVAHTDDEGIMKVWAKWSVSDMMDLETFRTFWIEWDSGNTEAQFPPPADDGGDHTDGDFNAWVHDQFIGAKGDTHCNLETYTEWHNSYYFFAGHDCGIYDLELTLTTSVGYYDNNMIELSEDARPLNPAEVCKTEPDGEYDECVFILKPSNRKLGIHFSYDPAVPDVVADLRIQTKWYDCVDNMFPDIV